MSTNHHVQRHKKNLEALAIDGDINAGRCIGVALFRSNVRTACSIAPFSQLSDEAFSHLQAFSPWD